MATMTDFLAAVRAIPLTKAQAAIQSVRPELPATALTELQRLTAPPPFGSARFPFGSKLVVSPIHTMPPSLQHLPTNRLHPPIRVGGTLPPVVGTITDRGFVMRGQVRPRLASE